MRTGRQRAASVRNLAKARAARKRRRRAREMRNGMGGVQRLDLRGTRHQAKNAAFRTRGGEIPQRIQHRLDSKIRKAWATGKRS